MFGTLQCDLPRKEPLTFVEDIDQSWALGQKPHVSCELCRKRKMRCDGKPSGCDKCVAIMAECRYPGRKPRRGKRPASRKIGMPTPRSGTSSPRLKCRDRGQGHVQGQGQGEGQGKEQRQPKSGQTGWPQTQTADASGSMFAVEAESDYEQQMARWLLSPVIEDGSSGGSVTGGVDDQVDLDSPPKQILAEHLENSKNVAETTADAVGASLLEDYCGLSNKAFLDFDDFDTPFSFGCGIPTPDSLTKMLIPSPYDEVSPLPSTQHQPTASNINSAQRDPSSQALEFACFSRHSPQNSSTFSRTSRQLGGSKPDPTPEAQMMASETPAITGAPLPDSTSQDHTKDGCRCLHLTAGLLEDLGQKSASIDSATIDVLLGYLRGALAHCATTLDCEQCSSVSENVILLAMAGRYMSTICERIVKSYMALRRAQNREQSLRLRQRSKSSPTSRSTAVGAIGSGNSSSSGTGGTQQEGSNLNDGAAASAGVYEMWFSTYRIESTSEQMQVLRSLVTVQLAEFLRLLDRLKKRAGNRQAHLISLIEAERRMKTVRSMLSNQRPSSI